VTGAALHIASATVKLAGTPLDPTLMDRVERIEVRQSVGLPDTATVRIADPEGVLLGNPAEPGTMAATGGPIAVALGDTLDIALGGIAANSPTPVFKGEVVALEPEFASDGALVVLRAYDRSHRLQRARKSKTYQQMTASDIVQQVCGAYGIPLEIQGTSIVHPFVQQSMESDWDFCRRLALAEGLEFGMGPSGLFLRPKATANGTPPELKWRQNLRGFKPRLTAVQQPARVVVRAYDPARKETVQGEASTANGVPQGVAGDHDKARSAFGDDELLVADRVGTSQAEVQALAQATLDRLASGFFEAEGTCEGDPRVVAGGLVQLAEVGRFAGAYEVSSVTHVYGHGDFRTRFQIAGRNARTLADLMRPKSDREWGAAPVCGLITNLNDPDGLGRVRVQLPELGDDVESAWARIALPAAGKDKGFSFRPVVGDEVLVVFEHGDTRRPVVVGFLWNGSDTPHSTMFGADSGGSLVLAGPEDLTATLEKHVEVSSKDHMTFTIGSAARATSASTPTASSRSRPDRRSPSRGRAPSRSRATPASPCRPRASSSSRGWAWRSTGARAS
jgi:phage protein D